MRAACMSRDTSARGGSRLPACARLAFGFLSAALTLLAVCMLPVLELGAPRAAAGAGDHCSPLGPLGLPGVRPLSSWSPKPFGAPSLRASRGCCCLSALLSWVLGTRSACGGGELLTGPLWGCAPLRHQARPCPHPPLGPSGAVALSPGSWGLFGVASELSQQLVLRNPHPLVLALPPWGLWLCPQRPEARASSKRGGELADLCLGRALPPLSCAFSQDLRGLGWPARAPELPGRFLAPRGLLACSFAPGSIWCDVPGTAVPEGKNITKVAFSQMLSPLVTAPRGEAGPGLLAAPSAYEPGHQAAPSVPF